VLAAFPSIGVAREGGVVLKAGGPWPGGFVGATDGVELVLADGSGEVIDFEATGETQDDTGDTGGPDTGPTDTGPTDTGPTDTGPTDTGAATDTSTTDGDQGPGADTGGLSEEEDEGCGCGGTSRSTPLAVLAALALARRRLARR
jgi:hypothetical protein